MQRQYRDKSIKDGDFSNKAAGAGLICVKECMIPGRGTFAPGDKILDAELVEHLAGNPYFEKIQEDK